MNKIIHETGQPKKENEVWYGAYTSGFYERKKTKTKWERFMSAMDFWWLPIIMLFCAITFMANYVSESIKIKVEKYVPYTPPHVITKEVEITLISGATITGYSSTVRQTDYDPLIMANGKKVHKGAIACPQKYPFGTKIIYAGNEYICEDRMNTRFRDGNYWDIWFVSEEEARIFGVKKNQTIKIIIN